MLLNNRKVKPSGLCCGTSFEFPNREITNAIKINKSQIPHQSAWMMWDWCRVVAMSASSSDKLKVSLAACQKITPNRDINTYKKQKSYQTAPKDVLKRARIWTCWRLNRCRALTALSIMYIGKIIPKYRTINNWYTKIKNRYKSKRRIIEYSQKGLITVLANTVRYFILPRTMGKCYYLLH